MSVADRVYWLHALTPVHVGTGRGESYIDLPLAREKATNLPMIPGSAVKGVLADYHNATEAARAGAACEAVLRRLAFGSIGDGTGNAGALVFTDARLVCLPVRSLYGTFAWCTSRMVLKRLARDLELAGVKNLPAAIPPEVVGEARAEARIPEDQTNPSRLASENLIYLEDLDFTAAPCKSVASWAKTLSVYLFGTDETWMKLFRERFVVLPDDLFSFLCETATEVQAHIRIDSETKIVQQGALWYEESLPAETVLAGLVWTDQLPKTQTAISKAEILAEFCKDLDCLQIGGKGSVGKGRVRCRFTEGATA